MPNPLTVKHVYDVTRQYARKRPDLGVGKALLDALLESGSPFDSKGMRSPKRWFVLFSFLAVFMFTCFVYFNRPW
jgi:hypothetical protein